MVSVSLFLLKKNLTSFDHFIYPTGETVMSTILNTITFGIINTINSKLGLSTKQNHYDISVLFRDENRRVDFYLTTCVIGDNFRCHARFTLDRFFKIEDWYLSEKENFGPGLSDETYFIKGTINAEQIRDIMRELSILTAKYLEQPNEFSDCGRYRVVKESQALLLDTGDGGYLATESGAAISLESTAF